MGNLLGYSAEASEVLEATPSRTDSGNRFAAVDCKQFLRESHGRIFDFYERLRDLGEGGFGEVFLAQQRVNAGTSKEHAGRLAAVKRVRKPNVSAGLDEEGADSEDALEEMRVEVELMKSLDHPGICRLLQVYEDPKNLYIVMEHIEGSELLDQICDLGNFGERETARVVRQVASALEYCHERGVVHRDIKPENIMVVSDAGGENDELTVKLIDFGFGSRILEGVKLKAKVGTYVYTAPEVFEGASCDEKQDLWALGCVLFVLLSGDQPFFGEDCKQKIMSGDFEFDGETWDAVSDAAKELIRQLLCVDPAKRLGAREVLQHHWIQNVAPHVQAKSTAALDARLKALEAYHQQTVFRHLAAGVLAKQLDEGLLHELHQNFCAMDKDENGVVSFEEFKSVFRQFDQSGASHKELQEGSGKLADIFHGVDLDGRGYIDYNEFVAACMSRKVEDEEGICWSAFQVFDTDCSGTVTFEELEQVLNTASMQETFPEDVRKQLWRELTGTVGSPGEEDKLKTVDFDHFLAALRGVRVPAAANKEDPTPSKGQEAAKPSEKPGLGLAGLPIARRHHGAAASMGLPIKSRSEAGGGLPIASRSAKPAVGGLGLPIGSRH